MTEITVHVHVHQEPARFDPDTGTVSVPVSTSLEVAPELEWSPTLCDGKEVTFEEAEKAVAALGEGWRLPTRREWCDIIEDTRHDPALDPEKHPGVKSGLHWTGTPCPWAPGSAVFVVGTLNGYVSYDFRNYECFVRAVRAVPGQ